MSVPDIAPITDWFIALLGAGSTRPIGDMSMPATPEGESDPYPYAIVYLVGGGQFFGGEYVWPESGAEVIFQVTSSGRTRGQAQALSDEIRRTIAARTSSGSFQVVRPDPDGYKIMDRQPRGGTPPAIPEGVEPNRVISFPDRFSVFVTPST